MADTRLTAREPLCAPGAPAGAEEMIESDLDLLSSLLLERFGDAITALVLLGPLGRAEGTIAEASGVDGGTELRVLDELRVAMIARTPIPRAEVREVGEALQGRVHAARLELAVLTRAELARLRPGLAAFELSADPRIFAGEPRALWTLPQVDPARVPRREAEGPLRRSLGDLLLGWPAATRVQTHLFHTSRAFFAAVDALLIVKRRFRLKLAEKTRELESLGAGKGLLDLLQAATAAKLHLELPADLKAEDFWAATARFHLDAMLLLYRPGGKGRGDRIARLSRGFAFRSIGVFRTALRAAKTLAWRNRTGALDALLLALAVSRDPDAPGLELEPLAQRARLGRAQTAGLSWNELRELALAEWRARRSRA